MTDLPVWMRLASTIITALWGLWGGGQTLSARAGVVHMRCVYCGSTVSARLRAVGAYAFAPPKNCT